MQPYQLNSTDWIKQELAGLLGEQVTRDINDIIRLYSLYDGDGQRWQVETKGLDYTPTVKVTNIIAELIGKEARYMMGVEPELHIVPKEKDNQAAQANADVIGSWLTALLEEQKWSKKLLDAAKDCFIGKRVALKLTGRRGGRLGIQFRPSLEFVFDTDPEDVDRLTKVIFFYHTNESTDRLKQRIWRQKYELRMSLDHVREQGKPLHPTILPDRIEGGVKPEKVIPFVVTKEQAQKQFEDYFKGKKLLPNVFLNSRNRISEMRRLYVPYWLFSCDTCADMVYDAEKIRTEQKGEWEITRTKHYLVRRKGGMRFEDIPVDGSVKMDDKLTESLEPYDLSAAIPFQSAVLAGAMADHADADCDACEKRAVERVEHSVEQTMLDTVRDYDTVSERNRRITTERGSATPALLPVWLMTTVKEGKTYTFAVNGQTGKLTCDVPADKKKSLLWGGGVFAGILGVAALILALMDALGSGSLLICAVVAAIIALAVVGALKGQLKQAAQQSAAGGYIREGSFRLDVNADHFLYESTTKRKIENNTQKK